MKTPIDNDPHMKKVQVELPEKVLAKLINSGLLHGNECRCLNLAAKKIVWKLLLKSSLTTQSSF